MFANPNKSRASRPISKPLAVNTDYVSTSQLSTSLVNSPKTPFRKPIGHFRERELKLIGENVLYSQNGIAKNKNGVAVVAPKNNGVRPTGNQTKNKNGGGANSGKGGKRKTLVSTSLSTKSTKVQSSSSHTVYSSTNNNNQQGNDNNNNSNIAATNSSPITS